MTVGVATIASLAAETLHTLVKVCHMLITGRFNRQKKSQVDPQTPQVRTLDTSPDTGLVVKTLLDTTFLEKESTLDT